MIKKILKKKFVIVSLTIITVAFLIYRFYEKKCYIELSDRVVIIEIETPKITGWIDGYYSKVTIWSAQSKYSLFPKLLLSGNVGGGLVDNNNCKCVERNSDQILILKKFYSNNSGKSFVDVYTFTELFRKQFNEKDLKICYPTIENNNLILSYNTYGNNEITKQFNSHDGGKTWKRKQNINVMEAE